MSRRKTFDVGALITVVNRRNKFSTCDPKVREGWNNILEEVLVQTGNYSGYVYLGPSDVPKGQLPGVDDDGNKPDETRRCYRNAIMEQSQAR